VAITKLSHPDNGTLGGINDEGFAVGGGFWWDPVHGEHFLNPGPKTHPWYGGFFAVSPSGLAVGGYFPATYATSTACVMQLPSQSIFDLNEILTQPSLWFLSTAQDISSNGIIVGDGTYNGQQAAWMLIPVIHIPPWLNGLATISYTPPRKLPIHILPGDPGPAEDGLVPAAVRAQRAIEYAARLLDGAEKQQLQRIAQGLRERGG
jgi:hypothetical protein